MGISREPWAAAPCSVPAITAFTRLLGKMPPFLPAIWVRSGTVSLSAIVAGPRPRPSLPWQTAQWLWNISPPSTSTTVGDSVFSWSDAETRAKEHTAIMTALAAKTILRSAILSPPRIAVEFGLISTPLCSRAVRLLRFPEPSARYWQDIRQSEQL